MDEQTGMPTNTAMNNEYIRSREEFDPVYYLIGLLAFVALFWICNRGDTKKAQPEENDPKKTFFTKDQLRRDYSGDGPSGKTYLCCNDTVFDVTGSPHYTTGASYAAFAGRDISIACAHYSTDEKYLSMPYDADSTTLTFE